MYLSPDVFIASFGDRAVALDLNTSRYLALGRWQTMAARAAMMGSAPAVCDRQDGELAPAMAPLAARGLVCDRGARRPACAVVMPSSTLWPSRGASGVGAATPAMASVMIALAQAQLYLAALPLGPIVRQLRAAKARAPARTAQRTFEACLTQFAVGRPWYPSKPICRLDAIALCLYLWRNGLAAELVFGVRLDPFAAHCWAQHGDVALNDAHDFVSQFSPIMAV